MITELFQLIQIFHGRLTFCDFLKNFQHPSRTDPAGRTFAAGLIHGKFEKELGDVHHTGILIHDDQSAGAHHGSDLFQVVIIDRHIQMLRWDTSAGRSSGLGSLELLTVRDTAADFLHDLP